jgi:hypothetical protein
MIRSALLSSLAGALLFAAAAPPLRAATPTVQSEAGAIVLKPLTLLKKDDLDFGTLVPSAGGGTATLDPVTGTVTATGGIVPLPGGTSPATFIGAGSRDAPYQIRLPKNPITLTRSGGTETMTVSSLTLDGNSTRLINAFEAFEFKVGGQLAIGANQAPGTYVGTFDVSVQYP